MFKKVAYPTQIETADDNVLEPSDNNEISFPILPVQDIVPVEKIYKGMIVTTDNRYIKILEVLPINFALRSPDEQDNIIFLFASLLKVAPSRLQFKAITRTADSREIIHNVRMAAEGETHPKCRELASNYIQFIHDVSGSEALSRRFFLIFQYEPSSMRAKTIDDIAIEMEHTARKIAGGLAACGNEVVVQQNEDYFQGEALYLFYNKASSLRESFADRVMRVTEDVMKMDNLQPGVDPYPEVHISNYVAPRGLEFTRPDYFTCDGIYNSIFYVTRDGYPDRVTGGWISSLIEANAGMDVDIILNRLDRTQVKEKVSLKLKLNRIKVNEREDTDTDYEEIEGAVDSAKYIKTCIANGEDFYNMHTFITVSAPTREELLMRKESVVSNLYSRDITVKEAKYRMEDAFQMVSPLLSTKKELMEFSLRNVMTYGAASLYPFTSCELCDEKGIILGINRRYQSLVNLDIFNTKKYKNANIAIIGTSGAGKTFTTITMAMRFRIQGVQTFIMAPDKAHEFQRSCIHIGGSYIRIAPGSNACINIMEIRPVASPISDYLDEMDSGESESWLAQKASQLGIFFHILVPDLTNEEEQLVDEAIIKTYSRYGITHDNDSIYKPGTRILKTMPILGNLYDCLIENPDTKRIANILGRFVTGSASNFNQQTNVDLTNKYIVFDLQDLKGVMRGVGMFIVADFLWGRIKENRTERKALFFDEGWQLIGASADTSAAEFVHRIFKTIRGYGGSAIFATQDLEDLFSFQDGKYGKAIISNSKIKLILGLEQQEARKVRDVLQLTKKEYRRIINFDRGEALLCANNNKLEVKVRASKLEEELITTDPAQLKAIIEKRRMERQKNSVAMQITPSNDTRAESDSPELTQKDPPVLEPNDKKKLEENARMLELAMDQLSDTEIARDPDGTMVPAMAVPLGKVEQEGNEALENIISSYEFTTHLEGRTIQKHTEIQEQEVYDPDLGDADFLEDNTQRNGGKSNEYRPPADF